MENVSDNKIPLPLSLRHLRIPKKGLDREIVENSSVFAEFIVPILISL